MKLFLCLCLSLYLWGDTVSAVSPLTNTDIQKDTIHIYLSPFGKDTNSGLKIKSPILTLRHAHTILQKKLLYTKKNVTIHIASGIYKRQRVTWKITMENKTITFLGDKNNKPIFDGMGMASSWFRLVYHNGSSYSNIHIKNIIVKNYVNAIIFKGNKNNWKEDVSRNKIEECEFINIGDKFTKAPIGYSAISLINSRYNIIENNIFYNIINNKIKCRKNKCFKTDTLIHGLYLAYYSSHNIIRGNRFENISGDAIKVRDYCNNNIIEYNIFNKVRRVFQDWYATYKNVKDEDHVECFSWRNMIRNNLLGHKYSSGKKLKIVNIKKKFYKNSGQEKFCTTKIFDLYHIPKKLNILYNTRILLHNNKFLRIIEAP